MVTNTVQDATEGVEVHRVTFCRNSRRKALLYSSYVTDERKEVACRGPTSINWALTIVVVIER